MNRLKLIFICFVTSVLVRGQQIANYVNNGGFEECAYCNSNPPVVKAKFWESIDTLKLSNILLSAVIPPFLVPYNSFTTQWPRSGDNYILSTLLYKPFTSQPFNRGYPRNTLKGNLVNGKVYCVKFYYNVTDNSSYGVNSLGAYFGDSSTDTISQCMTPITYLNPQIAFNSFSWIQDTANWIALTGTFTANGAEKYLILGNFNDDNNTDTLMINPTHLPLIATDILYDDVSCIDIDLPAYAGPDQPIIPGDSVFIGRVSDVEIDESCIWYQMTSPTTSVSIDTIAGLWVKTASTSTYIVQQQIWCSSVKWDTVVVFLDAVGLQDIKWYSDHINLFPNPTSDNITISISMANPDIRGFSLVNNLGQTIREGDINLKDKSITLQTSDLDPGIYQVHLKTSAGTVSKQFVKN